MARTNHVNNFCCVRIAIAGWGFNQFAPEDCARSKDHLFPIRQISLRLRRRLLLPSQHHLRKQHDKFCMQITSVRQERRQSGPRYTVFNTSSTKRLRQKVSSVNKGRKDIFESTSKELLRLVSDVFEKLFGPVPNIGVRYAIQVEINGVVECAEGVGDADEEKDNF